MSKKHKNYSMKKATLIFVFLSNMLFGQNDFVIKDVRLFDGEKVIEKTSILIKNGSISKVAKLIEGDYDIVEGTGKTLIPALTNAHVHVWSPLSLKEAAKAGVLNMLDMHGVEMMQNLMKKYNDSTHYANFFAAGAAAIAPEGHGTQFGFIVPTLTQPEEAKQFVEDRIKNGADYIKIIVEPWRKTLTHETVKTLIDEAHANSKIAVVHISKVDDAYKVLQNNADGLVHIWWDTIISDKQLKVLKKEKSFFVIPTLLTSIKAIESIKEKTPEAVFLSEVQLKSEVKRLYNAGIPVLAGTDPPNLGINYGTDLHKELILMSEAGIPNIEVLKGATSRTAKAFSLKNQGIIQKGYQANIVLIDGNPLNDIKDISKMLLNLTSFFIINFGGFSLFHFFAIASLATVLGGIIPAIKRSENWFSSHFYFMSWSVVGLYCAFWAEIGTRFVKNMQQFWWIVALATIITTIVGSRIINKQAKKMKLK